MDYLAIVREEVKTRFNSEEEVTAFMEGFEKTAGAAAFIPEMVNGVKMISNPAAVHWGPLAAKAGMGIMAGLAGAAIIRGVQTGYNSVENNQLKTKFDAALQQVINSSKVIKNADPTKVKSYAQTLFSFAPHVASDPNLLSSLLANAVLGEGVDPMTIKTITELESRYKENNSSGTFPSFKAV